MFRFLRYYSILSFVAFVVIAAVLGMFYRQTAISSLIELEESKNIALTQAFSNSLWPEFAPFVASASGLSGDELRTHPETARLHQAVLALMKGLSVVKVKVYNLEGLTVFSTEAGQIGQDKSMNAGYLSARSGEIVSEITHRDTFSAFEGTIADRDVLSSYVPIRSGSSTEPPEAVLEVYSDVTPLLQRMERTQRNVVIGVALILAVLYAVLFFIVRHADSIIRRQHIERKQAELSLREARDELEIRVQERTDQLAAVNEIAQVATSVLDVNALLARTVNLIRERFGFYHVSVFLIDETRQNAVVRESTGEVGQKMKEQRHSLAIGSDSIVGWVTANRKPRIALDVGADAVHFKNPLLPETRSEMALPLIVGNRLLGALDVQSTEETAFSEADASILQGMANQIAIAIDNAHLFAQTQASLEESSKIQRQYLREAWAKVTEQYGRPIGFELQGKRLLPLQTDGRSTRAADPEATDAGGDPEAILSVPLMLRGQTIGSLEIETPAGYTWSNEDRALVEAIIAQATLAIENARLLEETQAALSEARRLAQRERVLAEVTDKIHLATSVQSVLKVAAEELRRITGSSRAVVHLTSKLDEV